MLCYICDKLFVKNMYLIALTLNLLSFVAFIVSVFLSTHGLLEHNIINSLWHCYFISDFFDLLNFSIAHGNPSFVVFYLTQKLDIAMFIVGTIIFSDIL